MSGLRVHDRFASGTKRPYTTPVLSVWNTSGAPSPILEQADGGNEEEEGPAKAAEEEVVSIKSGYSNHRHQDSSE
jgi:hypothetical protein